jgi:hypothetical protein
MLLEAQYQGEQHAPQEIPHATEGRVFEGG